MEVEIAGGIVGCGCWYGASGGSWMEVEVAGG